MKTIKHDDLSSDAVKMIPLYGWVGILIILTSIFLLVAGIEIIGIYFTPLMWTGYILVIDSFQLKLRGDSLIYSHTREFVFMLPWSIACWLIFEAYNLRLQNWEYIGLPRNFIMRYFGYIWAFATIFPAILVTAEFIKGSITRTTTIDVQISKRFGFLITIIGLIILIIPLIVNLNISAKLFVLVWIGFILLIDPINYFLKGNSIIRDWMQRNFVTTIALGFSGIICGVLWELWNYWATAKWIYTVPISFAGPKLFEMPLLGYLGFIPFAFEVYVMQELLVSVFPFVRKNKY